MRRAQNYIVRGGGLGSEDQTGKPCGRVDAEIAGNPKRPLGIPFEAPAFTVEHIIDIARLQCQELRIDLAHGWWCFFRRYRNSSAIWLPIYKRPHEMPRGRN